VGNGVGPRQAVGYGLNSAGVTSRMELIIRPSQATTLLLRRGRPQSSVWHNDIRMKRPIDFWSGMLFSKSTQCARGLLRRFSKEIEFYRLVLRHPRTPRASRILLGAAMAYAASPVDLIPDFIPVIGHLDDLIIVPCLTWLATRLIPKGVITECRNQGRK
jgi:uncharacterized membrane protein YkvA (DUF1232 family)